MPLADTDGLKLGIVKRQGCRCDHARRGQVFFMLVKSNETILVQE
jgi:hypothetical protein